MSADVVRARILALLETLSKVRIPDGRVNNLNGLTEMFRSLRTSDVQMLAGHLRQTGLAPEADLFEKLYGEMGWHMVGEALRHKEGAEREHCESFFGALPQSTGDESRDREDSETRLALAVGAAADLRGLADKLRSQFIVHANEIAVASGAASTGTNKRGRGRPQESDPDEDRRIAEKCRDKALKDVAKEENQPLNKIQAAKERDRKRRSRPSARR